MSSDEAVKLVKSIPVSSLASYAGAAALLMASRFNPNAAKSVVAVASAAAMAFYSAEVHQSSPMRGHKHSAVVGAFVGVAFMAQAARVRTPPNVAMGLMGWGLAAVHGAEWKRLHDERVEQVRAHLAAQRDKSA